MSSFHEITFETYRGCGKAAPTSFTNRSTGFIFGFCWQNLYAWHPCDAPMPRQSLLSLLLLRIGMTIERQFCQKCNHSWYPSRETKPRVCPRCKSYNWEKTVEVKIQ